MIFTSSKRSFSSSSVGRNPIALQIKSKVFDKESIIVDFTVSSRTSWYHRGHHQRGSLVSSHQRGWNTPCYWLDGEQVQNCTNALIHYNRHHQHPHHQHDCHQKCWNTPWGTWSRPRQARFARWSLQNLIKLNFQFQMFFFFTKLDTFTLHLVKVNISIGIRSSGHLGLELVLSPKVEQ